MITLAKDDYCLYSLTKYMEKPFYEFENLIEGMYGRKLLVGRVGGRTKEGKHAHQFWTSFEGSLEHVDMGLISEGDELYDILSCKIPEIDVIKMIDYDDIIDFNNIRGYSLFVEDKTLYLYFTDNSDNHHNLYLKKVMEGNYKWANIAGAE